MMQRTCLALTVLLTLMLVFACGGELEEGEAVVPGGLGSYYRYQDGYIAEEWLFNSDNSYEHWTWAGGKRDTGSYNNYKGSIIQFNKGSSFIRVNPTADWNPSLQEWNDATVTMERTMYPVVWNDTMLSKDGFLLDNNEDEGGINGYGQRYEAVISNGFIVDSLSMNIRISNDRYIEVHGETLQGSHSSDTNALLLLTDMGDNLYRFVRYETNINGSVGGPIETNYFETNYFRLDGSVMYPTNSVFYKD